jgi:hypothetical protein
MLHWLQALAYSPDVDQSAAFLTEQELIKQEPRGGMSQVGSPEVYKTFTRAKGGQVYRALTTGTFIFSSFTTLEGSY